jgi:hypothetical protein
VACCSAGVRAVWQLPVARLATAQRIATTCCCCCCCYRSGLRSSLLLCVLLLYDRLVLPAGELECGFAAVASDSGLYRAGCAVTRMACRRAGVAAAPRLAAWPAAHLARLCCCCCCYSMHCVACFVAAVIATC